MAEAQLKLKPMPLCKKKAIRKELELLRKQAEVIVVSSDSDSEDDCVVVKIVAEDDEHPGLVYLEDGTEEWAVERIIDRCYMDGILHYRVKWKEWPNRYNTWEPINHLDHCKREIRGFEKRLAERRRRGLIKEVKNEDEDEKTVSGTLADIKKEIEEPSSSSTDNQQPCCSSSLTNPFPAAASSNVQQEQMLPFSLANIKQEVDYDEYNEGTVEQEGDNNMPEPSSSATNLEPSSDSDEDETDGEEIYVMEPQIKDATELAEDLPEDDEENEVYPFLTAHRYKQWGLWSYRVRKYEWKKDEKPLCILGSMLKQGRIYHLVRIEMENDPTYVKKRPFEGLHRNNILIVANKLMKRTYLRLLAHYYTKCVQNGNVDWVTNAKSEEEIKYDYNKNLLIENFKKGKVDLNYEAFANTMLPAGTVKRPRHFRADPKKKRFAKQQEDEDKPPELDKFGLPYNYTKSDISDSESDDEWEEVRLALPKINPRDV